MNKKIILGITVMFNLFFCYASMLQTKDSPVVIQCKEYYAEILPEFGGNCIRLKHIPSGIEVLRTPGSRKDLEADPLLYGMPILFFPNRIRGGRFLFEGRVYRWPLNEPQRNGYVHGDLYQRSFVVTGKSKSSVELEYIATQRHPYLMFAHSFVLRLRYRVDANGLHQRVWVKNTSGENMPFGLSFHTTFNLQDSLDGKKRDFRLKLPVDKKFLRDSKTLTPTGESLASYPLRDDLRAGTLNPEKNVLSGFFSRDKYSSMQLTDQPSGWVINYQADPSHKFWMLWNGGRKDLLVVEPQTCLIDPFNVDIPREDKGIIIIEPGAIFKNKTTINVKKASHKD